MLSGRICFLQPQLHSPYSGAKVHLSAGLKLTIITVLGLFTRHHQVTAGTMHVMRPTLNVLQTDAARMLDYQQSRHYDALGDKQYL